MSDEKLLVFARDSRADGTDYPKMALVPEGLFDPALRMKLRDREVLVEIKREDLPQDLATLPQPVPPSEQHPETVPLVAIDIAAEQVRVQRAALADGIRELERLQKGGIPNTNDEAVRGNVTPENGGVAFDATLPDAPSPLDGDQTEATSPAPELEAGGARAAAAAYAPAPEGQGTDETEVTSDREANAQELPAYLQRG